MRTLEVYMTNRGRSFRNKAGERKLDGYGSQRRYYGKAGVTVVGGVALLRSYDTLFAAAYCGRMVLLSELPTSTTTIKHLRAFADYCGLKTGVAKRDRAKWPVCLAESDDPEVLAWCVRHLGVDEHK